MQNLITKMVPPVVAFSFRQSWFSGSPNQKRKFEILYKET